MHLQNLNCCGIRELALLRDIRDPKTALQRFLSQIEPRVYSWGPGLNRRDTFRYVIFSATKSARYGVRFAKLIEDEKLGEVISTGFNKNPNTGHILKVWVWTVDHDALKTWKAKNG